MSKSPSSHTTSHDSVQRSTPNYEESAEQRSLPDLRNSLRPGYWFGWFFGFLERWFLSRSYGRLAVAIPFLLLMIGGAAFLWWLKNAPRDQLVKNYEQAVAQALQTGDDDKVSVYLESLVQLRPHDKRYRFQLALHLLDNGQQAKGAGYLQDLTNAGLNGYNPARLWLVTQAGQDDPIIPLPPAEIEPLLRLVVDSDPRNITANRLLADISLRNGKLKEAEDRLLRVVESVPALSLPLVKIQRLLQRSPEQIEHHLGNATEYYNSKLLQNPGSVELRIGRAEALSLAGNSEDAERVLKEGLAKQDSPKLRQSLSELYVGVAGQRLRESLLNRDLSTNLLLQASHLNPTDEAVLQQLVMLVGMGATVSAADLSPAIDALTNAESISPAQETLLLQAMAIAERYQEAIQRIENADTPNRERQAMLIRLYRSAGQDAQAESLITGTLDAYQQQTDALSPSETLAYADVLLLSAQPEQAAAVLKAAIQAHQSRTKTEHDNSGAVLDAEASDRELRSLQIAYGRVCLTDYDQRFQDDDFSDARHAVTLLDEALQTNTVSVLVLDRLAHLVSSRHEYADVADAALNRLLATGIANAEIYNLLGTKALELDNPDRARVYLERAYSLSRTNPMVLNNLALALVRGADGNADRAFDLISEALKILPEHPDALSTRAEVLIHLERWEEARRDLEIVLPQRKTSRNSRMLMAQVYDALEEPALAAEHRRILEQLESSPN